MILLSALLLFTSSIEIPESSLPINHLRSVTEQEDTSLFHKVSEKALYFCVGEVLQSASFLAKLGWGIFQISPWAKTIGNECLLISDVCRITAQHAYAQIFDGSVSFKKTPLSLSSWHQNQFSLSQIPAFTLEQKKLLQFLEKRWLAKATGYYSSIVDWICPCFGIAVQIHPESTSSYARDPWNKFSQTYKNRVESWKPLLPHPQHFPLILTRPYSLQDYLPSRIEVPQNENIQTTLERLALKMQACPTKIILDLTSALSGLDKKSWGQTWGSYQRELSKISPDLNQILCIETVQKEGIGGIRILPFNDQSKEEINLAHQYLLEWVSKFGLSANRIELDRWELSPFIKTQGTRSAHSVEHFEDFIFYLNSFEKSWKSKHPQKTLMLQGTLEVIRSLFGNLSKEKWDTITQCPTKSGVIQLCFSKIKEELNVLAQDNENEPFFNTVSHIEQIHASFTPLLEIFSPFIFNDFSNIYHEILTSVPQKLKPLTSYGIHSSAMTSLAGIFKAMERSVGKSPRVLYGENTYFEIIHAVNMVSNACAIDEATEEDWKEVDLIIAQFNPVLKRIDFDVTDYKVEKIAETLHKALKAREGKPLTLALDSTLDYINSPQTSLLLEEFQEEIEKGSLNLICYRSGLKFDLFGMDNYCGAPFYMIHNKDSKWDAFDFLCNDPVLQTDPLSLNWFCLAYQKAASHLEFYRKQVFDNTRAFLDKVPQRLLTNKNIDYRIIPVDREANLAFVDIKIYGPLHEMRSSLIGGFLLLKCMEGKHPIFNRPSLGFYHPNFCILFSEKCSTIRMTLGLDPAQVDLLVNCFETIDSLNGS